MRPLLISMIILCFVVKGFSQSVGIGTTTPNSSAILDITSTTQGFLFPRMTYLERTSIPSPPAGLLVYQTNSVGVFYVSGIYFFDGSIWKRIARSDEIGGGGGSTGWTVLGDNQYSNLTGNVGIGTSAPASKFHLVGNMLTESGTVTINNPSAILQLQSGGVNKGFFQLSGNNVRIGTNSGNTSGKFIIRMNGLEHVTIDSIGNFGIGTSTPESKLNIDGGTYASYTTNGHLQLGASNEINMVFGRNEILARSSGSPTPLYLQQNGGKIYIGGAGESDENPKVQIQDGTFANLSTNHGYLMLGESASSNLVLGNYEILARNNGAESPLYLQQEGGAVRIGTTGSTASGTRLHITDGASAGLGTHGYFLMGLTSDKNIVMDDDNIQARNNGATEKLKLNEIGGAVQIGSNADPVTPGTKLYIPSGSDASLSSDGLIQLGREDGTNLVMDGNEILVRNNGSTSTLYLQNDGGFLNIGGHTTLNHGGSGEVLKLDGNEPNIGFYHNGAYKSFISQSGNILWVGNNVGKLHLDASQIAVGTISYVADAYKLTVAGKILCEEVRVRLFNDWPDYVFQENYELTPLHELKEFISHHKHLPEIPDARTVAEDGVDIGEMNRKLLAKVEELTLYVIQLQEQIDELKDQLD